MQGTRLHRMAELIRLACCCGTGRHPVLIVIDVEALVRVDVDLLLVLGLLGRRAHKAPDRQVVDEQLVPARARSAQPGPCWVLEVLTQSAALQVGFNTSDERHTYACDT